MITVSGPNGSSVDFPDGTPPDTIKSVMAKNFGGPSKGGKSAKGGSDESPSVASGIVRSFSRGVPIAGGLLNKADAATDAALSYAFNPLFSDKDQLKGSFSDRYDQALKTQEGEDAAFANEHPYLSGGAEIAGGIASTGAAAGTRLGAQALGLTANTLPGMIASGAASGAGIGALDAATRGEDPTTGALLGGAAGAAGPLAEKAIGAGIGRLRGMQDSGAESEASRRVGAALKRDEDARSKLSAESLADSRDVGLTPEEFARAKSEGQPVNLMDTGGEATRALARATANASPEARAVVSRAVSDRFGDQGERVSSWFDKAFNFPNAAERQEAIDKTARAVNRPAYAKAYSAGAGGVWNEDLEQAIQAPEVQSAIRKAMVSAKSDAAKRGFAPPKNPFVFAADGRLTLGQGEDGKRLIPSLQFWDHVKRNLDAVGSRDAQQWSRILRDHLDEAVPEYKTARAGSSKYFGEKDALAAGQKAVSINQDPRQIQTAFAKMSGDEKKLFQDGFVDELVRKVREAGDSQNILNKIANSPNARSRVAIVLGPDKAKELDTFLRVEDVMNQARAAVQGNSTTARQLYELGDFASGAHGIAHAVAHPLTGIPAAAAKWIAKALSTHVDAKVAKHIAKLLTSDDPADHRKVVKMIAKNKTLSDAIRNIGSVGVRGATQAGYAQDREAARN